MAALDRVAETSERTRGRLREDAQIDEVAMPGVPHQAQKTVKNRVRARAEPEQRIGKDRRLYAYARRCCRYGQMKRSISPSSTAAVLPVSTLVR